MRAVTDITAAPEAIESWTARGSKGWEEGETPAVRRGAGILALCRLAAVRFRGVRLVLRLGGRARALGGFAARGGPRAILVFGQLARGQAHGRAVTVVAAAVTHFLGFGRRRCRVRKPWQSEREQRRCDSEESRCAADHEALSDPRPDGGIARRTRFLQYPGPGTTSSAGRGGLREFKLKQHAKIPEPGTLSGARFQIGIPPFHSPLPSRNSAELARLGATQISSALVPRMHAPAANASRDDSGRKLHETEGARSAEGVDRPTCL